MTIRNMTLVKSVPSLRSRLQRPVTGGLVPLSRGSIVPLRSVATVPFRLPAPRNEPNVSHQLFKGKKKEKMTPLINSN